MLIGALVFFSQPSGLAQAPTTSAELKALVQQMARTASSLAAAEKQHKTISTDVDALVARRTTHDQNPPNGGQPCPAQNTGPCDAYNVEANQLDTESHALVAAIDANAATRLELRQQLGLERAKLRIGNFLGALSRWRDRVVACSNLPVPEDMVRCMNDAWEDHP